MNKKSLLGITLPQETEKQVLEHILKFIRFPDGSCHIVSLNPEIIVLTHQDKRFKDIIMTAQIRLIDGAGIALAARWLNIATGPRLTGVDVCKRLLDMAGDMRLTVLLIGGRGNLAQEVAECYKQLYPKANFYGTEGIKDIKNPKIEEEVKIFSIVRRIKPCLVVAAFGSPDQEMWLDRHNKELNGMVVMGVGQGLDVLGGKVRRAPLIFRKLGLEWLYRLMTQPWRWRRQLRLIEFGWLVLKEKFFDNENN